MAKPPTTPVRPTVTVHTRSAALDHVTDGAADLVPVREVLTPPPSPARYFIAAAVLVVVAFVVALAGVRAPSYGGTLGAGEVRVAGTDVVSGGAVTVNLSKPVPVVVSPEAPTADYVELSASVLGRLVSSATAPLVPAGSGRAATVTLGGRYLVGGSFTGRVTLWRGLLAGHDATFEGDTSQSGLLSVPAGITLLLLLFTIGYGESLQRSLRAGKSTKTGPLGLAAHWRRVRRRALVGVSWVLFRQVPTATSLVLCAVLGKGAGVALAFGGIGVGPAAQVPSDRAARRAPGGAGCVMAA